jgi:hypothetical protein
VIRLERIERGAPLTCSARLCWIGAREERPNFVRLQPPTIFGKEKKSIEQVQFHVHVLYLNTVQKPTLDLDLFWFHGCFFFPF